MGGHCNILFNQRHYTTGCLTLNSCFVNFKFFQFNAEVLMRSVYRGHPQMSAWS